jgi:hypothetical protein
MPGGIRHVTSCPRSRESKSHARLRRAREKPLEPQSFASRPVRSLRRWQPARVFSASRSHGGRSATPSPSFPLRGMRRPVTIARPPVADQDFLRHALRIEQLPALVLGNAAISTMRASMQRPVREFRPCPAPLRRTHNSLAFREHRSGSNSSSRSCAVHAEDSNRRHSNFSCLPIRGPAPAPARSGGTRSFKGRIRFQPSANQPALGS